MERDRRALVRWTVLVALLVAIAGVGAWFLQMTIPRRIVLASGAKDGMYHELAQRYKAILARDGVTVVERTTGGAEDNARLLKDPNSGVDAAFIQGGVVRPGEQGNIVMLASLYFEPLWIFYRGRETLANLDELRYKCIAIGAPGQGVRAFIEPLLAANKVTGFNSELMSIGNVEAVRALQDGKIDAVALTGPVQSQAVFQALHDAKLKLMSIARADA